MKLFLASAVVALLGTSAHAATNKSAATQRKERQLAFKESAFSEVVQKHAQDIVAASPEMTSVWGDPSDDVRRKLADAESMFPAELAERKLRGLKGTGGSKGGSGGSKGGSGGGNNSDSACTFMGQQYSMDSYNGYFQIFNGEILSYAVQDQDDDYVTMCDKTKCFGDDDETVAFVATGSCSGNDAELQIAVYTLDGGDGTPTEADGDYLNLACPHITQKADMTCNVFDGNDGSLDEISDDYTVLTLGPVLYVDFERSSSEDAYIYACTMTCTGDDNIDLFD